MQRGIHIYRTLLFALVLLCLSCASFAQFSIGVAVSFGPPPIPVYDQPLCPGDGYIWTPGFWAYDPDIDDYYWVPGTWVEAPEAGYLWTPGWWGWGDGGYFFHDGYWGPVVGFYGGINYGFGYFGLGYQGGYWEHDRFFYNRSVSNVNVTVIHNVYEKNVVINNNTRVSYNGGQGGVERRATAEEEAAGRERHLPPAQAQVQHVQGARSNPELRASANMGKPPIAATPRPGDFKDRGVVQAKESGGRYSPPANRGHNQPGGNAAAGRPEARPENNRPENNNNVPRSGNNAEQSKPPTHVRELPPAARPSAPSTGNAKQDQRYQQQQEKLYAQQQKERQKVTQQQEKEDQRLTKQNAPEAQRQQQEQRHQQQTQQLQQKHQQQQQQIQQRAQPRAPQEKGKPPKS